MDPIQAATFSAYAAISRFAEPATATRVVAEDRAVEADQATGAGPQGVGPGDDAAVARQDAGQEAAPSEDPGATGDQDQSREQPAGPSGHRLDVVA